MNAEQFRSAINVLVADWAAVYADADAGIPVGGVHVFYENGPEPDLETEQAWLDVQLRFYSANTIAVGRSDSRYNGVVSLAAYVRETTGTRVPDRILGGLTKLLRHRRVGDSAILYAPERTIPPPAFYGWYRSGLMIPFVLNEWASDL